jgi:Icc-related predicted phosphoesterase
MAMRLLILSDLHLEGGRRYEVPEGIHYDMVVLAGDISAPGVTAVRWAADPGTFGGRPVVLVPGNHEYYDTEMASQLDAMRRAAAGTAVHVLSRDAVEVDGVRFLGATLWTDFAVPVLHEGGAAREHEEADIQRALAAANACLNDFQLIQVQTPAVRAHRQRSLLRLLTAEDTLARHWVERDWLRRELARPSRIPTVVVTHHAPHRSSVALRYRADWLTPAFVSDLPMSFFVGESARDGNSQQTSSGPVLWVHGHTHTAFDYTCGTCRVVSNPRGYRRSANSFENDRFDAGFVVDIPTA